MTPDQWFKIVGGIISIVAFVFSVWVWLRSGMKVRELRGIIQTAFDVSGSIIWETAQHPGEDESSRLRHVERALGQVSAIHTLTGKYAVPALSSRRTDVNHLVERGILWTGDMAWDLERSDRISETWIVTPDLEPDLSEKVIGVSVGQNVRPRKALCLLRRR